MALTSKKYESLYTTSGGGANELSRDELVQIESWFDLDKVKGMDYHVNHPDFAPLIFQMQQMQDELDYLRTEISTNKDKKTIPVGLNTTVSFGDMIDGGKDGYSIVLTVTRDFGGKVGVVTKTSIITLK